MGLYDDMKRALEETETDDGLKDVELIGSDGRGVLASKAVLSLRSVVFRRMFFGEFREGTESRCVVPLDYPSSVVSMVVKYCYTDVINYDDLTVGDDCTTGDEAVAMVQLRDFANYLDLVELYRHVSDDLAGMLLSATRCKRNEVDLGYMCRLLEELMVREGTGGPLWSTCMELIEEFPESCLLPKNKEYKGVQCCSFNLLETIFVSIGKKMRPDVAAKALQLWNKNNSSSLQEELDLSEKIMRLADGVDLESMEATKFVGIDPCPLFPATRLYKAVRRGVVAKIPNSEQPLRDNKPIFATVRGAGLEPANGVYTWSVNRERYELVVEHGSVASVYSLRLDTIVNIWKLSCHARLPNTDIGSTVAYSSTSKTTQYPPFSSWKSTHPGFDPTPCISVHGCVPGIGKETNPVLRRRQRRRSSTD